MNATYTVRRLTPTECARLQGFPDWWADLPQLEDMTDEAFSFWQEVRATHAAINGKTYKPVSKRQMIKWYNKLHTDSAEYKMWGNGVALPVVRIPLHGMAQLGAKTMGSLFDGSGGLSPCRPFGRHRNPVGVGNRTLPHCRYSVEFWRQGAGITGRCTSE